MCVVLQNGIAFNLLQEKRGYGTVSKIKGFAEETISRYTPDDFKYV